MSPGLKERGVPHARLASRLQSRFLALGHCLVPSETCFLVAKLYHWNALLCWTHARSSLVGCRGLQRTGVDLQSTKKVAPLRGWRNTVGNLIELLWLCKTYYRLQFTGICVTNRGGKVSSNSRSQTVPVKQHSANLSPPCALPDRLDVRGLLRVPLPDGREHLPDEPGELSVIVFIVCYPVRLCHISLYDMIILFITSYIIYIYNNII